MHTAARTSGRAAVGLLLLACAKPAPNPIDTSAQAPFDWDNACQYASQRWHCRIAHDLVVDIVPHPDTLDTASVKHLAAIEVIPKTAAASGQTLPLADYEGMPGERDISVRDLDGDGFGDLRVRRQFGNPDNEGHFIWRYDPMHGRYVYDALLSEETNVEPDSTGCITTQGMTGHAGGDHVESRYCLRNAGWALVRKRERHVDDSLGVTFEDLYELRGDSLRLVKTDTSRQ